MKFINMKCPCCGAEMEEKGEYIWKCPYCDSEFKQEKKTAKLQIDDAKRVGYEFEKGIIQAKKESVRTQKAGIIIGGILIIGCVFLIIGFPILSEKRVETKSSPEVSMEDELSEIDKIENLEEVDQNEEMNLGSKEAGDEKIYKKGEMVEISDANGSFKFGILDAKVLKETGYRDAVYQITWETDNENYVSSLGTGTLYYNLKVVDSEGYMLQAMSDGWDGDWENYYVMPEPGEKCKSKYTFKISNPRSKYLDVTLTDRTIKCRVEIEELDKVVSSIPKDASEKEKEIIKTAQGYVTSSHMSYDGIVKQLEYEGYSYDEATYGAEYCGADWKEQAVKAAKSYMSIFPEFTKDKLVEQLEYDGFSNENAIYAGDNCDIKW